MKTDLIENFKTRVTQVQDIVAHAEQLQILGGPETPVDAKEAKVKKPKDRKPYVPREEVEEFDDTEGMDMFEKKSEKSIAKE